MTTNIIEVESQALEQPSYARPTMREMSEKEILAAFQMTAAKISAAGCWWSAAAGS